MYSKILINIVIVIIITVAVILLTNLLWQWQQTKLNLTDNRGRISRPVINQQTETASDQPLVVPPVPEPTDYSRFAGIIQVVTENSLTLSTIFGEKIINFDDNTAWQKIYLNKFPPLPGSDEIIELPPAETLQLSDLTTGQEIEVASNSNISGQRQFVASEINLLERVN